jgi:natural product biosynthesis luciferase-like monooxygenase protein
MEFSLFYFANEVGRQGSPGLYRLLLEGARFADRNGFSAVWTPERHFHPFGGGYPNPSVTGAALAAVTERIGIRAGSVVAPLHHPLRIAEEWSVVDNLSGGRVGISFASGWHAVDFVLAPDKYAGRKESLTGLVQTVRSLWRGDALTATDGCGQKAEVRVFPPPVQRELPVWVTSSGNPRTYDLAGALGANLLTHLLGQDLGSLAEKVARYRSAFREATHGERQGHVTLMLHAFLADDVEAARAAVREPLSAYLRSSFDLVVMLASSGGLALDPAELMPEDAEFLVARAFDRYFERLGLFGTPRTCGALVDKLAAIGVDEIACLIDFGLGLDATMSSLQRIAELARRHDSLPVTSRHLGSHLARSG